MAGPDSQTGTAPVRNNRPAGFVAGILHDLSNWYEGNKVIFWAAYTVTLISYSYLFTSIGFTNHTFPEAWTYSLPSYRTVREGRWFSDFLRWLLGGAGVQSSQMYVSVGLFIVVAIVVAGMFGAEGGAATFLAVVFLNLYPANLDRYSFPGCEIVFVAADAFAVLGVLVLSRQKTAWKAAAGAVPLFVLSFATYQPAVALAAFLVLAHCLMLVLGRRGHGRPGTLPWERITTAGGALVLGSGLYYATAKMTTDIGAYARTQVNGLHEILGQIGGSYPALVHYFSSGSDYLPVSLRGVPLAMVLLGAFLLLREAWGKGAASFLASAFFLGAMPVALRASYIINSRSFEHVGRIVHPYGFALLFFLLAVCTAERSGKILRIAGLSALTVLISFSFILATQETNKMYLKMIFDTNKINRIAARIEEAVPDLYDRKAAIVVIGNLPMGGKKFTGQPNKGNSAEADNETFATYRQPQILNFYFGREIFVRPTSRQRDRAILSSRGRRPWPSPESIYVDDDVVVVLLEKYRPGVSITWTE